MTSTYLMAVTVNKITNYGRDYLFASNQNGFKANKQATNGYNGYNGNAQNYGSKFNQLIQRNNNYHTRLRQNYKKNAQNNGCYNDRNLSRKKYHEQKNNPNFYANNGRQNKRHNICSHNHQYQAQQKSFANNQRQQTAQKQTFMEQVDDAVLCISLAGKGYHNGQEDDTVDILCDAAVVSLNLFAVSCEQLHKEKNKDALDLGRKRVHDRFGELELKNKAVYKLIEPHRNFINAALNGQKNLKYRKDRVAPGAKGLFERDPAEINKAFGHMIHQQQKFDKSREALLEQKTNAKLARQHESELNEYRRNKKKYGNNNKRSNKTSKSGPKYDPPKVTDLYFTKNGKSAKFVDAEAVLRAKKEQQAMEQDLFGSCDVYGDVLPQIRFMNAAIKWTKQRKWNGISEPMPCQILLPNKKERKNQDKSMIVIRPCNPWNNCTLFVGLDSLELDETEIKRIEKKHIDKLVNLNVIGGLKCAPTLGYKTIKEQEKEIDIDHYVDNDSNDVDMISRNSNV